MVTEADSDDVEDDACVFVKTTVVALLTASTTNIVQ